MRWVQTQKTRLSDRVMSLLSPQPSTFSSAITLTLINRLSLYRKFPLILCQPLQRKTVLQPARFIINQTWQKQLLQTHPRFLEREKRDPGLVWSRVSWTIIILSKEGSTVFVTLSRFLHRGSCCARIGWCPVSQWYVFPRDMCAPEHISLVICVSRVGKHKTLKLCIQAFE